jgi:phosphoacetylglucosamine mutase
MCTATGVKYLHKAAHNFDIGIYFEANGHGTTIIGHEFEHKLEHAVATNTEEQDSLDVLRAFFQVKCTARFEQVL